MAKSHYSLLIPERVATGLTFEVTAPYDGQVIATIESANQQTIEQAIALAYRCFRQKKHWIPLARRIEILQKTAEIMQQQQNTLAYDAAHEGGKPLMDSKVEVARAIDGIQICIETLRTQAGDVIPMRYNAASKNRLAFTQKEPIGVVLAVSAFNHPFNLIVHQVAAAVAAGCPVIVKPASDTPLSCMHFVEILHQAGLPEAWCQALYIKDNELANQLVKDHRLGFFSFIGSAKVGWKLRSELAPGVRCALEHGGVAPVIVANDADLAHAVPLLTKGGFYHAGQVCVSVQRVFADDALADELTAALADSAQRLVVGDPTLETTEVGPLIRPTEVDRVAQWVSEAKQDGATIRCGGEKLSEFSYGCTVLENPSPTSKVSQHEVFGPVVCVTRFKDLEAAIEQANALPFAFQGAVFTRSLDTALHVYQQLDASAVMVNDHTAFRVDGMPFAGLRHSGLGVGGIPHTIADMQIEKMCVIYSEQLAH